MSTYKFKKGDEVVVTGDTEAMVHCFGAGTVGSIINMQMQESEGLLDPIYMVESGRLGEAWWVHENDLRLNNDYEPVTDEEVREALASIAKAAHTRREEPSRHT